MRVSLRTTYIMDMGGTFTPMEITTSVTGSMESGLDGENLSTSPAKSMKECGSIANS